MSSLCIFSCLSFVSFSAVSLYKYLSKLSATIWAPEIGGLFSGCGNSTAIGDSPSEAVGIKWGHMSLITESSTEEDLPETLLISVYILLTNFFINIFLSIKKVHHLGWKLFIHCWTGLQRNWTTFSATSNAHLFLLMELFLKNFLHVGLKVCSGVSKLVSYFFHCYQKLNMFTNIQNFLIL